MKRSKQLRPAWLHMRTVQMNNMPKGIPTKITCGARRSAAGVPPCGFVGGRAWKWCPTTGPKCNMFPFLYQGRSIAHDIHNPTAL
eukprot:737743-Ditylum_brightwellii.AAC.1